MKKFVGKSLIGVLLVALLCGTVVWLSEREPFRTRLAVIFDCTDFCDESGMDPVYEKAQTPNDCTTLIIGDSVCRQIYTGIEKDFSDATEIASNAATMITGQYALLMDYLDNHPDTKTVYFMMHPMSLTRTFDADWSYRYSVMVNVEHKNMSRLDESTRKKIKGMYGALFVQPAVVNIIEKSPIARKLYLTYIHNNVPAMELSNRYELADLYVMKMYEECRARGIEFYLLPTPVTEHYKPQCDVMAEEDKDTKMYEIFPDYYNDIYYFPDEWSDDLTHFSGDHAKKKFLKTLRMDEFR